MTIKKTISDRQRVKLLNQLIIEATSLHFNKSLISSYEQQRGVLIERVKQTRQAGQRLGGVLIC